LIEMMKSTPFMPNLKMLNGSQGSLVHHSWLADANGSPSGDLRLC
jgi:hypothetical protein